MDEYDNVISISYDSVKGKFGIYIHVTHVDAYCAASHQIYTITISFDEYLE